MRENRVRAIWEGGGAVVNAWLGIPSSFSAEVMASCGWDSVTIDLQHGLNDFSSALPMLQAISTTDATPLCRVPALEPGIIQKLLDAGSYGIICPMVNTREQCARLVAYCRYAPEGERSFGPLRAVMYGGPDYPEHANRTVLAIAMVETAEGLANVEEIAATPGLDGIYVGPSDLALSLGAAPRLDPGEGPVAEAMRRVLAAGRERGVPVGLHCGSPEYALRMIGEGFRFVSILNDSRMLAAAATAAVEAVRSGLRR